jgi:hypothetical protein
MAKIINGQLTGLLGALVAVRTKNGAVLRSAPRERRKWSFKQHQTWKRFTALTNLWNTFKYTQLQKIWKIADRGGRGINLFIQTNMPAFGTEGELMEVGKLHFSAGKLPLPHYLTAVKSNPGEIKVLWDPARQPGEGRGEDLLVMQFVKDEIFSKQLNTGVQRKTGSAALQLPAGFENSQGVYLSFANEKRGMYSGDQYFELMDN